MAKQEEETAAGDDESLGGAPPRKGKRLILVIVALVLLLGAVGAGLYFSGILPGGGKKETAETAEEEEETAAEEEGGHGGGAAKKDKNAGPVFYEMPEFLINLNTGGRGVSFLKMKITLELSSEEMVEKVKLMEPRISDSINTYLRELRASDLSGSSGLYRLREELLMRVNKTLHPKQVNDILFKEIIVQ
jgi:flagellar FliL protein